MRVLRVLAGGLVFGIIVGGTSMALGIPIKPYQMFCLVVAVWIADAIATAIAGTREKGGKS